MTWFPQAGTAAGCPACGGTNVGGTLELFHAGIALIVVGLIGWFLRHGPLAPIPTTAVPALAQSSPVAAHLDRASPVVSPARKKPVVTTPARKNQVYVSSKKLKSSKVKRRPKKAKTRSKHVQR